MLALASSAHATTPEVRGRISRLEAELQQVITMTVHGNLGGKTASATPQYIGDQWYLAGDMLWWHVEEGGNEIAVLYGDDSKTRSLDFNWNFGFRAGIGKTFNREKWDLFLGYTWLRADRSFAASLHGSNFLAALLGLFMGVDLPTEATQIKASWKIAFNVFDLNLGRNLFVTRHLALHPYIGLKGGWIDQHRRVNSKLFSPEITSLHTRTTNDFWGIGPSAGVEARCFLGDHLHLLGQIGGALLWGDFTVKESNATYKIHLDTQQIAPMLQMQLGMGYATTLHRDRYALSVSVRYENQLWWDQNQMPYFPEPVNARYKRFSEDLSLQGITVDVRWDY
ncbi:MAG: hypothetical protein JSS61_06800 [Verrucomicrobia bacterium]|nr:hypothetical protein [Verrucomicrobiota bacterium]